MINQEDLERVVCRMVAAVTDIPVDHIMAGDPNTGSPDGSYCVVRLQNPQAFGQAMKSQRLVAATDNPALMDIMDRTATQLIASFSVNFYRDNAMGYAASLLEAHRRIPVQAIMRAGNVGWNRASPVNNLSELYSGNIEQRAQLNVYLFVEDAVEDRVKRIYQVNYAVSDESEVTLIQGNINGLPS